MASGIKVTDDVMTAYDEVNKGHKYKYVTFKVAENETEIIVESKTKDSTWDEFQASLPANEPRWCVYDFDYKTNEGQDRDKLVIIRWCPDDVGIKKRMIHSSSSDALMKKCKGFQYQANDRSDLNFEEVRGKILATSQ
ncbi:uncharacterized protein LOC144871939 [Branchiostoma floridae x Branchiostoma japonicum]